METKEIKINIPEGYEIDKENSTFECIKFKPIKKEIHNFNYQDICNNLFEGKHAYYTSDRGEILEGMLKGSNKDPNNALNKEQLERLLALNQLLNIAYYCNKGKYVKNGYMINYNREQGCYKTIEVGNKYNKLAAIDSIFENDEDAQAVIDNPNFRSILDTLCK